MNVFITVWCGKKSVHFIHKKIIGPLQGLWCLTPLSKIFHLYRGGQFFIGGGNRSTQRKPPTCRKSLTNFITYGLYIAHNIVIYGIRSHNVSGDIYKLIAHLVINPTTIRSRPRRPLVHYIALLIFKSIN